jgi:hypothetical protein
MSILLTTPEATPDRTKADLVALAINRDTRRAALRFRITAADGSAERTIAFAVTPENFAAFLAAASIDRAAIERFVAANFLEGTVN